MANCKSHGLDPEMYLTEVIKRLPHNATVEQAAELTPARFAAALRVEQQVACDPARQRKIRPVADGSNLGRLRQFGSGDVMNGDLVAVHDPNGKTRLALDFDDKTVAGFQTANLLPIRITP